MKVAYTVQSKVIQRRLGLDDPHVVAATRTMEEATAVVHEAVADGGARTDYEIVRARDGAVFYWPSDDGVMLIKEKELV